LDRGGRNMKKDMLSKTLVMGIIILFVGVGVNPAFAVNIPENIEVEPKDYLFETIIEIANNPDVKELFEQYDYKIFTSDYDYKDVFSQLFLKKPKLLLNILFTKPSITYEYLNKSYNRGIKCVNILGEKQALKMTDSIKISNPDILNELNNIIKNDKELSNRISTLKIMNNDLKLDSPFMFYPIICAFMILICIPIFILLLFLTILGSIFMNNPDLIEKYPVLFSRIATYFLVTFMLIAVCSGLAVDVCGY